MSADIVSLSEVNVENNNININNYDIDKIERKILITNMLKEFNECVDNNNYDEYEREQELLRIVFEHSNINYKP